MGSRSETHILYFWNNYSKLALKKLYKGFATWFVTFCVNFVEKFETFTKIIQKTCFWMSSDFVIWDSLKKTLTVIYIFIAQKGFPDSRPNGQNPD